MNWWIKILSIYFLFLSFAPCGDAKQALQNNTTTIEITNNQHNHTNTHEDHCSPLCSCNCCNLSINLLDFKSIEIYFPQETVYSKHIISRKFSFISSYYGNIWQPPKI